MKKVNLSDEIYRTSIEAELFAGILVTTLEILKIIKYSELNNNKLKMTAIINKSDFLKFKKIKEENKIDIRQIEKIKELTGLTKNQIRLINQNYIRLNYLYGKEKTNSCKI